MTGIELIRKKTNNETYTFTWPLITDATGKKFGKSEGNALFLDEKKTTPYALYQYFMNTHDDDLDRYLKLLTLLELSEIHSVLKAHLLAPEKRLGQKRLAYEVVNIIHGREAAILSEKISEFLFGDIERIELLRNFSSREFELFFTSIGGLEYTQQNLFELFVQS